MSTSVGPRGGLELTDPGSDPADLPPPPSVGLAGWRLLAVRTLVIAAVLAVWQLASGRWIDPFFVGSPTAIGERLWEWVSTGYIFSHLLITLQEAALGFLLGATSGIVLGYLLGRYVSLAKILDPIVSALNALPRLALAPLFVVWFGIDIEMKMVLGGVIVFFLVFYNTAHGVRDVDEELQDVVRVLGANQRHLVWKVIVPSALPSIYVGLRMALPYSLVGAVVGEIVAANRGLGWLISYSAGQFDTNGVFASLVILMIVAMALNAVLSMTQRRALKWRPGLVGG
ncbi:MAG: ABC transporter permease subunit [Actinophytocola sp.]|uniref:ABC transporter permease n=1 Tax=Actinophytocola sp. TaxID=1872138 RepID=UPI00132319EE|nr:ABC transporter permease [Actinophytocola sp.]MPZ86358.1 ABC transporter permease subunit [Actinophytocola sp.]